MNVITAREAPVVDRVEVAVVEVNLPPQVKQLKVEEPGVVFLAAPPPTGPVIEAVHPDVNGIFTVIDDTAPKNKGSTKGKKYYRAGFRTVSWQVSDPNKDPLRFRLEVEPAENVRALVSGCYCSHKAGCPYPKNNDLGFIIPLLDRIALSYSGGSYSRQRG